MRKKKSLQYLILAFGALVVGTIVVAVLGIALGAMSVSGRYTNSDMNAIVERTASLTGSEDASSKASDRIERGLMSTGDYVIRSLTSSEYLSQNKDDEEFAHDLSYIVYGEDDPVFETQVMELLDGSSRMYAIDRSLSDINRGFAATSTVTSDPGDSFENCVVTKALEGDGEYTIGIRKVEGTFEVSGDEVRTDFFVDGVLFQGNIKIMDNDDDPSGAKDFVMAWDTMGVDPGEHSVLILLRSSDGRGRIISGGNIKVPRLMTLVNDNVQYGSIDQNTSESWYVLDAGDRNAYINFVGASDDIKVTMYDVYGELIGTNDLEGSDYEVLRGRLQDTAAITEETGIPGVSNSFYVKVERGIASTSIHDAVTYTMVQSREVARYDGAYMAVLDDPGFVPTPLPTVGKHDNYTGMTVRLADLNNNVIEVERENIRFLPLNGFLTQMSVTNYNNGEDIKMFPSFSKNTVNYGYYNEYLTDLTITAEAQEGYACSVTILLDNNGTVTQIARGERVSLPTGENKITVSITSFDGDVKEYNVYILNGDDLGDFSENTLEQFPTSYRSGLWLLHSIHPTYSFRAYNTGLDFYDVLDNEDSGSRSLANINSHPGWVQSDSPVYDGGGWMAARESVVAYFLDPRNFLEPEHIFSFELLSFDPNAQTIDGVRNIISGSFMEDDSEYDYAQIIYDAGQTANVSPYFLASRILQEMGYQGQSELCHGTLEGYEGYYNFYNIGSTPDPDIENGALINGARYAQWGRRPDEQEITAEEAALMLPWDSVERAITGGALWIAGSYIEIGQDTLYFQKFDVVSNEDGLYEHQYAQNISMAYSEGSRYFSGYASIDSLELPFTFVIPVYTSMPESFGTMPDTGA